MTQVANDGLAQDPSACPESYSSPGRAPRAPSTAITVKWPGFTTCPPSIVRADCFPRVALRAATDRGGPARVIRTAGTAPAGSWGLMSHRRAAPEIRGLQTSRADTPKTLQPPDTQTAQAACIQRTGRI